MPSSLVYIWDQAGGRNAQCTPSFPITVLNMEAGKAYRHLSLPQGQLSQGSAEVPTASQAVGGSSLGDAGEMILPSSCLPPPWPARVNMQPSGAAPELPIGVSKGELCPGSACRAGPLPIAGEDALVHHHDEEGAEAVEGSRQQLEADGKARSRRHARLLISASGCCCSCGGGFSFHPTSLTSVRGRRHGCKRTSDGAEPTRARPVESRGAGELKRALRGMGSCPCAWREASDVPASGFAFRREDSLPRQATAVQWEGAALHAF